MISSQGESNPLHNVSVEIFEHNLVKWKRYSLINDSMSICEWKEANMSAKMKDRLWEANLILVALWV